MEQVRHRPRGWRKYLGDGIYLERRPGVDHALVDLFDRDLAQVRAAVRACETAATAIDGALQSLRRIPGGREAGERLFRRLEASAQTVELLLERERRLAERLQLLEVEWREPD